MRRVRTLFALTGALLLVGSLISSKCYAGNAVPLEDPTYDWFKLGSNVGVLLDRYWNSQIDHNSDQPYQRIAELMTKLHATDSTLRSFQDWLSQISNLTWTRDADAAYSEALAKASSWYNSLKDQAARETSSRFFFLLGYHTGKIYRHKAGFDVGYETALTPEEVSTFRDALHDFHAFATDSQYQQVFAPLDHGVQQIIARIGSYYSKLTSRPASLSSENVVYIVNDLQDIKETGNHGETFYPAPNGGTWLPQEAPLFL